jgi:hypothetical protein
MRGKTIACAFLMGLVISGVFPFLTGAFDNAEEENNCPLSIEFSTLLGGQGEDGTGRVAIDSQGNIVLASKSPSTDFPIVNAYQPTINGSDDGVIIKLSPDGQELLFSTFFGGSQDEYIYTVAVDSNDDIIVAGTTDSSNLPLKNAIKTTRSASTREVFLAKFSSDGQELRFSTYICGTNTWVVDLGVDSSDNIVLAGSTDIDELPATENTYQPNKNGLTDVFVTKISPDGQSVFFSTFFGGDGSENIRSMTLDSVGNIVVSGYTDSEDLPQASNLCNKSSSIFDNYIGKLSADGQELLFSSYYGGTRQWGLTELNVDQSDNILFVGETNSISFPLVNPYQSVYAGGETDGFVAKINGADYSISFSTFYGGRSYDGVLGVVEDNNSHLIITGSTQSNNLSTLNPYQTYQGAHEAFICRMSETGQIDLFASYFGGSGSDYSFGSALDASTNSIILYGHTSSNHNFPLVRPIQEEYKGGDFDMFVCKFTINAASTTTTTTATGTGDLGAVILGSSIALIVVLVVVLSWIRIRPSSQRK